MSLIGLVLGLVLQRKLKFCTFAPDDDRRRPPRPVDDRDMWVVGNDRQLVFHTRTACSHLKGKQPKKLRLCDTCARLD